VRCDFSELSESSLETFKPIVKRVIGMYSSSDNPDPIHPSTTNPSYIQISATFQSNEQVTGKVEAVIIQATDLDDIGFYDSNNDNGLTFCCNEYFETEGICDESDTFVIIDLEHIHN
jgi:hypothetical protein